MEESWQKNGRGPPACDNNQQPGSSGGKLRMPTVHEALPYTPLSSIVPFNSGQSAFTCCDTAPHPITRTYARPFDVRLEVNLANTTPQI